MKEIMFHGNVKNSVRLIQTTSWTGEPVFEIERYVNGRIVELYPYYDQEKADAAFFKLCREK